MLTGLFPSFSVESTALRLITALGSSEVQPQFTRFLSDPKTVLSAESEELNRALILTLARATHVTGNGSIGNNILSENCSQAISLKCHLIEYHGNDPVINHIPDNSGFEKSIINFQLIVFRQKAIIKAVVKWNII